MPNRKSLYRAMEIFAAAVSGSFSFQRYLSG